MFQSEKVRPIDNYRSNSLNRATAAGEKLRTEPTDLLLLTAAWWQFVIGVTPQVYKEDVEGAYRILPLRKEELDLFRILVMTPTGPRCWDQKAFPFGAVSAVHAWNRTGEALSHIMRQIFLIPVLRYVDDVRGADGAPSALDAHNVLCRVMDEVIGLPRKVSKSTPPSSSMVDLGARLSITPEGFTVKPDADKLVSWRELLSGILQTKSLTPASAGSVAGKLA